jgi:16S rRNA (adenine1518-N6/adenine1519-N6)-dimethyltransferase
MNDNHRPDKKFGQHFLIDGHIADHIVDSAGITSDDRVLEIGSGKGILTERLIKRARDVTAVEIDRNLLNFLKGKFGGEQRCRIIGADILKVDLKELFKDITGRIKVVSNIPYNISTPIIELLCRQREIVTEAVLMVQKEVAQRLLAKPGSKDYGLTTLNLALCARGRRIINIKPEAFCPQPEVMSSVISLVFSKKLLYSLESEDIFRTITGVAFKQRRKMVRNTLVPYMISQGLSKSDAFGLLTSGGINPESRPETVSVENFVNLSNVINTALS